MADASGTAPPWVAASAAELLAGADEREPVDPDDGKSGSSFERVVIDGERYFLKSLSRESDWIMRVTGDHDHRPFLVWRDGIMSASPTEIDHTVVGMAIEGEGDGAVLSMLMRDVGEHLIPEGDETLSEAQHLALIDGLAALSAHHWDWRDPIGLTPMATRVRFFAPDNIAPEIERAARPDAVPVPIRVADEGWRRLPERAPALADLVFPLHRDPSPLVRALADTPRTFLHGDWKLGNLGVHPDGRTILIDWAYPGAGPACWDLAWYLALNRARLPISKEDTIAVFREDLERRVIDTAGWFERQLGLCLLGMAACMGWEKAVGDEDELRWWDDAAQAGAAWL